MDQHNSSPLLDTLHPSLYHLCALITSKLYEYLYLWQNIYVLTLSNSAIVMIHTYLNHTGNVNYTGTTIKIGYQ